MSTQMTLLLCGKQQQCVHIYTIIDIVDRQTTRTQLVVFFFADYFAFTFTNLCTESSTVLFR